MKLNRKYGTVGGGHSASLTGADTTRGIGFKVTQKLESHDDLHQ